ncbi:hypothetical protein Tco_1272970 [Tanacetum coccineum]
MWIMRSVLWEKDSNIRFIIQNFDFHILKIYNDHWQVYMTIFPDISRRARDMYHNLQDDDIMKNIFNSRRHKNKVGMQIPAWMITDEMKLTEHYRMYTEVFRIDVPLTQSQPTVSTQGTHRTPSAPRSPNPDKEIHTSNTPAPSATMDKADEMILQDTLHVSLFEHKSHEEQEARENVALVDEHLASEEIEKMVDGQENIVDDSSIPRNDEPNIPGTRIEPRGIRKQEEGGLLKIRRRDKWKLIEETRNSPIPTPIRSPRIHTNLVSSDIEKLQELTDTPHTTS